MMNLKEAVEKCKTPKQVLKVLDKAGVEIYRDDTDLMGYFTIWIDELTRIYKPTRGNMKYQKFQKVNMVYSGIPTFFGNPSNF